MSDTSMIKKWQYYAVHAKKKRIRKKYRNKLNNHMLKLIEFISVKKKLEEKTTVDIDVQGMTRVDKFKVRLPDGRIVTHPAFIRDGKEIDCIYIGSPVYGEEMMEMVKQR